MFGKGLIPEGKEKEKARQAVFLTPTNPSGDNPREAVFHDDFTVPKKELHVTRWKYDQNAVYWVRMSKAQDQGLEFWQTKSFAITTCATILRDSQNGERENFQRLETTRFAQQQQHSGKDVPSLLEKETEREYWGWSTRHYGPLQRSKSSPEVIGADYFPYGDGCFSRKGNDHGYILSSGSCERRNCRKEYRSD